MPVSRLRPNPTKIFISYRRAESAAHAGRLSDQLSEHFGRRVVFMDRESIAPGLDFVKEIKAAVGSCKVLLAVIGQEWLTCVDKNGLRRLDDPDDVVVLEIATALGRNVRVIPVLVQGALMPAATDLPADIALLAGRQASVVSDVHWPDDVKRLIGKISADIKRPKKALVMSSLAVLALFALMWFFYDPFSVLSEAGEQPTPASTPTPTPTPALATPTQSPMAGDEQTRPVAASTPKPTATPKAKPTHRPTPPPENQAPEGNCNQRDTYNGLCKP